MTALINDKDAYEPSDDISRPPVGPQNVVRAVRPSHVASDWCLRLQLSTTYHCTLYIQHMVLSASLNEETIFSSVPANVTNSVGVK